MRAGPSRLRTKLLLAFAIILAPVLVLLWVDFRVRLTQQEKSILDGQLLIAQAMAVQIDDAFDALVGFGWAVANDPLVHARASRGLNSHLAELVRRAELPALVAVYDTNGRRRGFGASSSTVAPTDVGNSPDFQRVLATNLPHISNVLPIEHLGFVGILAVVPIRDTDGQVQGAVMVGLSTDQLLKRYEHARLRPGQALMLTDRTGRLAFHTVRPSLTNEDSEQFAHFEPLQQALSGIVTQHPHFDSPILPDERLIVFVPTKRYRWVVGVSASRSVVMAPIEEAFRTELAAFAGILLLSFVLAVVLARVLVDPVRSLESAALALGQGDLSRRVPINTNDELGRLGATFNAMAARLDELYREQGDLLLMREEFMQAAAHELNTPIAIITSSIYLMRKAANDAETLRALSTIGRQTERMRLLVDDLLTVSRLRSAHPDVARRRVDLGSLIGEVVQRRTRVAAKRTIALKAIDALTVDADPDLIRLLFARLLENAIEASPDGAAIEVSMQSHDQEAVVSVLDHGPGIPSDRRVHLFEPFYESIPSGAPNYRGVVSLRLHVCRRIVDAHHGRIWAASASHGSMFSFALPLSKATARIEAPANRAPL